MRRYDRRKDNPVYNIHPIDVYNRANAARPAAPTNPPATRWLAAEPALVALAAGVEPAPELPPAAELPPAEEPGIDDGAMLEVMVEPAELVVVT